MGMPDEDEWEDNGPIIFAEPYSIFSDATEEIMNMARQDGEFHIN